MNNFIKRTISGIGFAAIMLAAFLTNKYIFGIVMLFALIVMMREFLKMTCGKDYWFSQILSILAGATLFSLIYLYKGFDFPGRLVILAFVPVFVLMINSLYVKDKSRFDKFSNLYSALLYIAVPWSLLNFAVFGCDGEFNGILRDHLGYRCRCLSFRHHPRTEIRQEALPFDFSQEVVDRILGRYIHGSCSCCNSSLCRAFQI